jgi:hypothetical protein
MDLQQRERRNLAFSSAATRGKRQSCFATAPFFARKRKKQRWAVDWILKPEMV